MEYSDNLISSAEQFAKMAKEYSSRLKKEKLFNSAFEEVDLKIVNEIYSLLKNLIWLYAYIKRNVRSIKLKSLFEEIEDGIKLNIEELGQTFTINQEISNNFKNKKLNNLRSCIRFAISTEAELINRLLLLTKYKECQFVIDLSIKHLEIIKKLSNF